VSEFQRERPAWMEPDEDDLPHIHPVVIASDQVIEAITALNRHPETFVRWPYPELDALTGPMAPGNVWFVCATSGGGKTTFVASTIDLWQQQGKRIYVMALETRPHEFRTYLACMAVDFPPGDALSGNLLSLPHGPSVRDQIKAALMEQTRKPYVERVMVSGTRAINLAGLEQGLKEAKAFGADVVIVDHIDHIAAGDGKSGYEEAKRVNDMALRMAQDNDLLLLFTSQLNQSAGHGDALTKYQPPRADHIAFGSLKQRNATGMIGLYRPIRVRQPDESEDDYAACMKAARAGHSDLQTALEPNTMGVTAMKLRNYGSREGAKVMLGVRHGRVFPLEERDRYQTGFGGRVTDVYGGK
jgi:KaiC/GvpD/RAD55 family RecA-like ATPase